MASLRGLPLMNNVTRPDRNSLTNLWDFTNNSYGCTVFFFNWTKWKVNIRSPWTPPQMSARLSKLLRLACSNSSPCLLVKECCPNLSEWMDRIFRGLPFDFIFLDDVLVASSSRRTHLEYLCVVLRDDNVFIFQKNDQFVMKTTTKNRKRNDRF